MKENNTLVQPHLVDAVLDDPLRPAAVVRVVAEHHDGLRGALPLLRALRGGVREAERARLVLDPAL